MSSNDELLAEMRRDREDRERQHREMLEALRASQEPAITKATATEKMRRGFAESDRRAAEAAERGASVMDQNEARNE